VKFSIKMIGAALPVKPFIFILTIFFSACALNQVAETGAKQGDDQQREVAGIAPSTVNKAIDMIFPHEPKTVYSLYGVELGESKSSVEDKYKLVACRQEYIYFRCMARLDTRNVTGISANEETTVFIAFKKGHVHSMSIPVFDVSLAYTREMLSKFYGVPASTVENKTTWSNSSGAILLEENVDKKQFSVVSYSVEKK